MESRKRVVPPHCINGCEFKKSVKNCDLCAKCFGDNEGAEIVKEPLPSSSMEKSESSTPGLSFSGGTDNSNSILSANTIFGASSDKKFSFGASGKKFSFGASSGVTKQFSFSSDYNNKIRAASGSIFEFTTLPEICARNFTFGTSTVMVKRCNCCKKRIGMTGFACKCGHLFCGKHRYPEEHKCSFDYKAFGRDLLRKQNPALQGDKLQNRI